MKKLGGSGIGIRPDDGRNPLSGGEGFFRGSQIVDFKDLKSITSFSLAVEGVADATESAQLELREWLIDIEIARDFFLNSTLARTGGGVIGIQTAASRDPLAGGSFFGGTSLSASDLENAKNEEAEARRKETQARQRQRQELVLLSSVLDSINPKLGTIGKNFLAVHASIQLLSNPSTGAFGVLGAGAAIFTASLTILNTVFGQGKSQADKLREAEQRLANQRSQAAAGFFKCVEQGGI